MLTTGCRQAASCLLAEQMYRVDSCCVMPQRSREPRIPTFSLQSVLLGGAGDGFNTFNLPDLRGMFLRGVDVAGVRDPDVGLRTNTISGGNVGNKVGSYQSDAVQGHHHGLYYYNYTGAGGGGSAALIRGTADEAQNTTGPTKAVKEATTDGTHGTPRISNETRPINAYVNYIIKY